VIGKDGLRGVVLEEHPTGVNGRHVLVQFEDGRRVLVPKEALVQKDGTFHLSLGIEDLDRVEVQRTGESLVLPVVHEELELEKRTVETGGVRVRKIVHEREETVETPVLREEVHVERVAVNRMIDSPVGIRHEGDTLIVPVLEEVLVVEKRLMLKEELRITKKRLTEAKPQHFTLRTEEAVVEPLQPERPVTRAGAEGGKSKT
jgi:uncharacterized protein (TIGR02271 family)